LTGAADSKLVLEQGGRLFRGQVPLTARMVGHTEALPQAAVRCTNCHQRDASAAASTQDFGPKLDARTLTQPVPRRGGPPSSYDAKSLCRVLTDGIDPAHVMIPQSMPRYTFTISECEALWTFLIAR